LLLAHATDGYSAGSSIDWMNKDIDPEGKKGPRGKLSYHYIIERDGIIYRMKPIRFIAYHAGDSAWPNPVHWPAKNKTSVNPYSIGIAWALKKGERPTDLQMESGLWLFRFHMDTRQIPLSRVVGHDEVSPGRKFDPKESHINMSELRLELAA
jgi:N-acetyl-anhydromuramyl-L-alanine amidase AmpD